MTINVIVLIDQSVNDTIHDYKSKKDKGQATPAIDIDLVRARFSKSATKSFRFDRRCKKINKDGKVKKQKIDWVPENLYIDDPDEFFSKLSGKSGATDMELVGAWNMDGSQLGRKWVYDDQGVKSSIVDSDYTGPVVPFNRETYIDIHPDITIGETTKTARQALLDGDISELSQINTKVSQGDRDLTEF